MGGATGLVQAQQGENDLLGSDFKKGAYLGSKSERSSETSYPVGKLLDNLVLSTIRARPRQSNVNEMLG